MPLDASCLLRNSEDTLNTACDAAGDTTDRAADGSTNRAGRTAADSGALLCTTHNSLGLDGSRHGENSEADCGK